MLVECDLLPQANGSARVSVPPDGADVLAVVKADMVEVDRARPDEGLFEFAVELGAGALAVLSSREAEDLSIQLSNLLTE
jgi:exosome complex RNA-binding protein Rrp42 (RNase PH superfamily)